MSGQFFWYDVMTTDTAAGARFYGEVVGWGTQEAGSPAKPYTLFTLDGHGVAGLLDVPDEAAKNGARPAWLGYIAVDDVDAAVETLQQHGGRLHRAAETVPGTIRFAVVSDPQGAAFYLAQGLSDTPRPDFELGTPGTIGWRELYAGDWVAAFAFYETMFGWTKAESYDMGPMGTYQVFSTGGVPVGGMMTKPEAMPQPFWSYYFNVPAIDAAAERVTSGGGRITMGPAEVPGGQWIVQCFDPQGAHFGLVAPKR